MRKLFWLWLGRIAGWTVEPPARSTIQLTGIFDAPISVSGEYGSIPVTGQFDSTIPVTGEF